MSSEYKKLLHEKSVRSALVKRDASALNINNLADKLKGLKDKPFNPRIFNNYMKEFDRTLADLKQDNHIFVQHIMYAGTQASKDEEFKQDQVSYNNTLENVMCAEDEIRTYFEENGSIAKASEQLAVSTTDPGIAEVLKHLSQTQAKAEERQAKAAADAEERQAKAAADAEERLNLVLQSINQAQTARDEAAAEAQRQAAEAQKVAQKAATDAQAAREKATADSQKAVLKNLIEVQKEANAVANSPKPVQPFWTPKGDMTDYLSYKSFVKKFDYFVTNTPKDIDKLNWLMSSVKGNAYEMIKHLTLEDANYEIAKEKLKKAYLDDAKIKDSLAKAIYQYKNQNPEKNYANVIKGLITLENYIAELKNVHKIDCYETAADFLISHIITSNLPGPVKIELSNKAETIYPKLTQIFELVPKAVDKLNWSNNQSNSIKDNSKKSNNSNSDPQNDSNNSKAFINVNSISEGDSTPKAQNQKSKKNYNRGNSKYRNPPNCRFCHSRKHTSSYCPKYADEKARMEIIIKQLGPKKQCKTCLQADHPGYVRFEYHLCRCSEKNGTIHTKVMCPKRLKTSNDANHPIYNTSLTIFDPAIPDHDTGIYSTLSKSQRAVALQTAVFAAVNKEAAEVPLHSRNIAILADTAAQRSLVTKDAVN